MPPHARDVSQHLHQFAILPFNDLRARHWPKACSVMDNGCVPGENSLPPVSVAIKSSPGIACLETGVSFPSVQTMSIASAR